MPELTLERAGPREEDRILKHLLTVLRARFLAGVLVTVPIVITFLALRFLFQLVDNLLGPLVADLIGREVPGLGLAVSYGIVKNHRGDIRVFSVPGESTRFTVEFPIRVKNLSATGGL